MFATSFVSEELIIGAVREMQAAVYINLPWHRDCKIRLTAIMCDELVIVAVKEPNTDRIGGSLPIVIFDRGNHERSLGSHPT